MAQSARIAGRILILLVVVFVASVGQASADPSSAGYTGRWIDVNLSTQTITAFQAGKAMYTAGVSSGKPGYATPTGTYFVISRFRVQDMSSANGVAQPYFQPNVEYILYFHFPGGYALHANYWQPASVFGHQPTSHGCVGMLKKDAAYFWDFADIGTPVFIHNGKTSSASPIAAVSSVVGKDQSAAQAALADDGFEVAVKTSTTMLSKPGTVMWANPPAGEVVAKGSTVTLTVAADRTRADLRPPDGSSAWAPDVIGLPEADAIDRIEKAGLKATYINYFDENSVPAALKSALQQVRPGAVFAQLTAPGQAGLPGSEYEISVRRDSGSPSTTPLRLVVTNTLGDGVNLRESPSVTAGFIRTLPPSTVVVATGPSVVAQGSAWYPVRDDRGTTGWVQGVYLALAPSSQQQG